MTVVSLLLPVFFIIRTCVGMLAPMHLHFGMYAMVGVVAGMCVCVNAFLLQVVSC